MLLQVLRFKAITKTKIKNIILGGGQFSRGSEALASLCTFEAKASLPIYRLKEEKIAIFDYNDEQLQDIFNGADRILKNSITN